MNIRDISGAILAGGQGARLGGNDKGLIDIAGRPMVAHVIDRFRPQVSTLVINANRNLSQYRDFGFPIVQDATAEFAGPLAGIAAALRWCKTPYLAIAPCDTPFLPQDFVQQLGAALLANEADVAVALGADRPQPTFTIISIDLTESLGEFLNAGGRKIAAWYRQQKHIEVDFGPDDSPFANVNSPQDLSDARTRLLST